ncbi:MAG: hypothetical protein ABIR70_23105 [Bryobacteraceae bacterium]
MSILKSVGQPDVAAEQRAVAQRVLARCIQSVGQYAIELKSDHVEAFRTHLEQLRSRAEYIADPQQAELLHSDFRGELRSYRDMTQAEVSRLRGTMADVIESMQVFLAESAQAGTDHHEVLQKEFGRLEVAIKSGDLDVIREAARQAAETTFQSYEEIQRAQEIVIAQLRDEIRHLHAQVGNEKRISLSDPATGLWSRAKMDARIQDLILLNETFCVFLIGVPALPEDPRVSHAFLRALAGRLQSAAGLNGELGMAGRWSEEVFAIVFNLPLPGAPISAEELESKVNGPYAIHLDGVTTNLSVEVRVQARERGRDSTEGGFCLELGHLAIAIGA